MKKGFILFTIILFIFGMVLSTDAKSAVIVDCAKGETIAKALEMAAGQDSLVIIVRGTCEESVTIQRDSVTIKGDDTLGGAVNSTEEGASSIRVDGARWVVIDHLTVGGKGSGVVGFNSASFTVSNSTISENQGNGVYSLYGANATIVGNTIENNAGDGVYIEDAKATLIDNTISNNDSSGIRLSGNSHARIGFTVTGIEAGNTISSNVLDGIGVFNGSNAFIRGNTIAGNMRSGVNIANANGRLIGQNIIDQNQYYGVVVSRGGILFQGKGDFAFQNNRDTISNTVHVSNQPGSGVVAFNNATLDIQDALIVENQGNGISLDFHSTLRILKSEIQDNDMNGIWIGRDSGLFLQTPAVVISGNGDDYFGISCSGGEASYDGDTSAVVDTIDGNCTGF